MTRTALFVVLSLLPAMAAALPATPTLLVVDVWPGTPPGDSGTGAYGPIGHERVRDPNDSPTKNATWITNVTTPTLTVYRPPQDKNTGAAVIVCPGGGYWNLAWDLEGTEVAEWFQVHGITGIVLKYRVPRRAGEPEPLPAHLPLLDAQRAISLVRSHAKQWEIDPHHIGICGFSAGGHLAIAAATSFEQRSYTPIDDTDRESCRPDFAVAAYPGYLVDGKSWELLPGIHIPAGTPPVFLVHAYGDTVAGAEPAGSVQLWLALKRAGIPAELHVYGAGEHGFGVRKSTLPVSTWGDRCIDWLRALGMLNRKAP